MLPKSVMIVEDEVITQRYLKDMLTHFGIKLAGSFEGSKGVLQALQHIKPDIILMDINIKGSMDGIQLSKEILSKYQIPIIFITAYHDDETVEEVVELSPYGFITKPFTSKDIHIALKVAYKKFLTHQEALAKESAQTDIVISQAFRFSMEQNKLYHHNNIIKLTHKQTLLIELLVQNINHTIPQEAIIAHVWHNERVADSSLRTLIYSLRKLLPTLPLHSDSKRGYFLCSH